MTTYFAKWSTNNGNTCCITFEGTNMRTLRKEIRTYAKDNAPAGERATWKIWKRDDQGYEIEVANGTVRG